MKVSKSKVEKVLISGVDGVDPITVYFDDIGDQRGKVTIVCWDNCYSHWWPRMGEGVCVKEFFLRASTPYLIGKLSDYRSDVVDYDDISGWLKRELIKRRKDKDLESHQARDLWDRIDQECRDCKGWVEEGDTKIIYDIIGCDHWWVSLPETKCHRYKYLEQIISIIKKYLRTELNETI